MLLKDLLEEFILELQMQNYSPRTINSYRNNNLLMFTFWAVAPYKEITYRGFYVNDVCNVAWFVYTSRL
ncbi:hypothetical protein [Clostridium beijerinckii]|uniref:hypothetical protein n=1 Tax=Clostridium beijerinckii TaxID=1520 RepID=UPI001F4C47A0|nr:hypothetical protein [Clostridium beijerinckii]NRT73602.1 hypothetical protein [Clostridium beijerinckii]